MDKNKIQPGDIFNRVTPGHVKDHVILIVDVDNNGTPDDATDDKYTCMECQAYKLGEKLPNGEYMTGMLNHTYTYEAITTGKNDGWTSGGYKPYRYTAIDDVKPVYETTTDKNGNYSLTLPDGDYTVLFSANDYYDETKNISVPRDKNIDDVSLSPITPTHTFSVTHTTTDILATSPITMYNGVAVQNWTINSSADWTATKSGDWFTIDKTSGKAGETVNFKINITKSTNSQNNGTITFKVEDTEYKVNLVQKASHLKGWIITGASQPVTGAIVTVSNGEKSYNYTTGENGVFDIPVPNAWYTISVAADGYESKSYDHDVQIAGEDVDVGAIPLTKSTVASLTATIKDGDEDSSAYGQALAEVSLDVYDSTGNRIGNTAKSNENGIVAFEFPAAGTYKLVFSLVGYKTVTVDSVIINENTTSLGTYDMMKAEAVTSISGTTTPGTKLELLDEDGKVLAETIADENGYYDFGDIPGWDGTIFRIRVKDTTLVTEVIGGATGIVIDTTITIFTISVPEKVQIANIVGAISEWEIESSHVWSVTATGDTSWYTLSSTTGECGITEFTVTANSVTDAYRESVLTFALNNRTFDVTIYQDIAKTKVSGTTTPGTILELLDEDGNVIAETTADENGNYDFGDIPGWDGTIFRIRVKDTTLVTEVVGGDTDVVIDTSKVIFIPTISYDSTVILQNTDGATSEWEIETSHPWTITKSGDTSWYTLSAESGNAGTSNFVVTAIGATDSYRESTLTFALNNKTFDVTICQNFIQTVSGYVVEQPEDSEEAGIEMVEIAVCKANDSSIYSRTYTNVNGQYTITFEDAGEYVITAKKDGYTMVTVNISVSQDTADIAKITMKKTSSPYYFNGHTYLPLFPQDNSVSWEDAEAICQSLGGHLVSITSEGENRFVTALTEKGISAGSYTSTAEWWWIGAYTKNGNWKWSDGEEFGDYTNWMGEPESASLYGLIYSKQNNSWSGGWSNIQDTGTRYAGIVCEWDHEIEYIEGVCKNDLKWTFTLDGTLTVSGDGILWNNNYSTTPWRNLEYNIVKVELTSGITGIGRLDLTIHIMPLK